jgi:hypothetical protein
MRIKLSYSVEEEEVLREAAKIISLCGDSLQQGVTLFADVQQELRGPGDITPNISRVVEMIGELRKSLFVVDTRCAEVLDIVLGYQEYMRPSPPAPPQPEPEGPAEDN